MVVDHWLRQPCCLAFILHIRPRFHAILTLPIFNYKMKIGKWFSGAYAFSKNKLSSERCRCMDTIQFLPSRVSLLSFHSLVDLGFTYVSAEQIPGLRFVSFILSMNFSSSNVARRYLSISLLFFPFGQQYTKLQQCFRKLKIIIHWSTFVFLTRNYYTYLLEADFMHFSLPSTLGHRIEKGNIRLSNASKPFCCY